MKFKFKVLKVKTDGGGILKCLSLNALHFSIFKVQLTLASGVGPSELATRSLLTKLPSHIQASVRPQALQINTPHLRNPNVYHLFPELMGQITSLPKQSQQILIKCFFGQAGPLCPAGHSTLLYP